MQTATIYNHETVPLDGESFSDCEFRECRLVYRGGEPPVLRDCRFVDCEWKLDGAAAHTLAHLKIMWGAGAKPVVQALIKDITGGPGR